MAERQAPQSFTITSGENITLEFTVSDNDSALIDTTGGSGRFVMARSNTASTLDVDSDASPQTATVTPANASPTTGRIDVAIDDSVTDSLSGDYYYELKWTDASANESVVAWGWITVEPSLT